jgi:hypothetical protein
MVFLTNEMFIERDTRCHIVPDPCYYFWIWSLDIKEQREIVAKLSTIWVLLLETL